MRFSDIDERQWLQLKPYLDTCLLPITGLSGSEEPWEATKALEELRDLMEAAEGPFRGRVVSYPAYHYVSGNQIKENLQQICNHLRNAGFSYIIVASRVKLPVQSLDAYTDMYDLMLSYPDYAEMEAGYMKKDVRNKIVSMWEKASIDAKL